MNHTTLGNRIVQQRKALGMTQADLAAKMNVTDKAVSKWERDLSCPDISSLGTLADVLNLSLEELMQTQKHVPAANRISEIADTALKGVSMAMGIAVTVLTLLNALAPRDGMLMLAIGLTCLGIRSFSNGKDA